MKAIGFYPFPAVHPQIYLFKVMLKFLKKSSEPRLNSGLSKERQWGATCFNQSSKIFTSEGLQPTGFKKAFKNPWPLWHIHDNNNYCISAATRNPGFLYYQTFSINRSKLDWDNIYLMFNVILKYKGYLLIVVLKWLK